MGLPAVPSFPLVNVVGIPGAGVIVEVATSPIESHRVVLNTEILRLVLQEAQKVFAAERDLVRTIEKSKL